MTFRFGLPFLLVVCLSCLSGCGSSTPGSVDMGGEDGTKVAVLVEELNELKGDAKKMADSFTSKPSAGDAKKFNTMTYYIKGKPEIKGTTATCKVLVEKQDGTPLGELEWSFEKMADGWKIKSAPLP